MSLMETISESTNWLTIVLAVIVCLAIYVYVQWTQMPPGPVGLPYLGYYPFLSKEYHLELQQMSKKYEKIFCFKVTGQLYANIGDLKTVREIATKSDCFETRPTNFTLFQDLFGGGIFHLNGDEWKVPRKFFILKFKEFGMGKKTQEIVVQDCLKKIVNALSGSDGNEFRALKFFSRMSGNVIRHMIFGGVKLDENDVQRFAESYMFATEFSSFRPRILLAGPLLKYILIPFVPEYRNYRKHRHEIDAILGKIIQQHEKEFNRNNIRNLVDAYINERQLLEDKKDPKAKFFTEETTLGGCRIPKGTIVAHNMWAVFNDPELYYEPYKFDPTRYLAVDGNKPRCEIPTIFGVGKRSCAGEPMVNMQLLLYIATVLQHFDLHPVKKHKTQTEEWDIFIRVTPRAL